MKFCKELTFRIPSGWDDLTPSETRVVFKALASDDNLFLSEIPAYLVLLLSKINIIGKTADGSRYLCAQEGKLANLEPIVLASLAERMQWVTEDPVRPWRPEVLGGRFTIDAEMLDISFVEWLRIDDSYTGALYTRNLSILDSLCPILLTDGTDVSLQEWERMAILRWIQGVKTMLSVEYPDFFVPVSKVQPETDLKRMLRESVDSQLRALTKGDITKEEHVLNMPLRRALAELNAQAREYREFKQSGRK